MTPSHSHLVLVLGDQLTLDGPALRAADKAASLVLMVESLDEATYVPQHQLRLVQFFSAMRHFADALRQHGWSVRYLSLGPGFDGAEHPGGLADAALRVAGELGVSRISVTEPGDFRVKECLTKACARRGVSLECLDDDHFIVSPSRFAAMRGKAKSYRMEHFYRRVRREEGVLMADAKSPVGARWNFDADNRKSFGRAGPGLVPRPPSFTPDPITRDVIEMVAARFSAHPGQAHLFEGPVTREQAQSVLRDFIEHRLSAFGYYQDAMATGEPLLYHSALSAVLNLHLLDPREVVAAAVESYDAGRAPLNAVEGFVRQVLGWREFIRGIYWQEMPGYAALNALGAHAPVPAAYWGGQTEMNCVRQCATQLVDTAYTHHIQRLMVLGLFAMLAGVQPYRLHEWHMAMYNDAVDWVSLPNVIGMSQHADGGIVGSKPYCASGRYIQRMSDYCRACRYDPAKAEGEKACPVTVLYWDFLRRHEDRFSHNPRMSMQLKNLGRKTAAERRAIATRAGRIVEALES